MLCSYGCGNEGKIQFKNGNWCCALRADGCPSVIRKRVEARKNNGNPWRSEETSKKISKARKGKQLPLEWREAISNSQKGIPKGPMSDATKEKIRNTKRSNPHPAWNKGLTVDDARVKSYVEKQTGQVRTGNYAKPDKWKGQDNPWFGKNRSKENSPRYNGEKYNRELTNYKLKVAQLTEQTYNKYKNIINPDNLVRSLTGTEGGYQLDHIYPVSKGFENNVPPILLASIDNLRMMPWKDNRLKSNSIDITNISEPIKQFINRLN